MAGMSRVQERLLSSSSRKYPLYAARLAIRNSAVIARNKAAPARLVIRFILIRLRRHPEKVLKSVELCRISFVLVAPARHTSAGTGFPKITKERQNKACRHRPTP